MDKMESEPLKNDWTIQLLKLRALYEATGGLHEGLVQQLKLWPYAVDPSLETSVCKVDEEAKKVIYEWESPLQKRDKGYNNRLKELLKAIKLILGDPFDLQILLNGTPIFPLKHNGKRKSTRPRRNSSRNNRKGASNRKSKSNSRRK